MISKNENGFHFYQLDAAGGTAEALIVLLHGHGSNALRMKAMAGEVAAANPGADILLVEAPNRLVVSAAEKAKYGIPADEELYTWMDVSKGIGVGKLLRVAFNRVPVVSSLNRFMDAQLAKRNLKNENLAVAGFSLGGALSLITALGRKSPCAAVVCHSGSAPPFLRVKSKTDVLLIMGKEDFLYPTPTVDPAQKPFRKILEKVQIKLGLHYAQSVSRLRKKGLYVEESIVEGLGHTTSRKTAQAAAAFIARHFKS